MLMTEHEVQVHYKPLLTDVMPEMWQPITKQPNWSKGHHDLLLGYVGVEVSMELAYAYRSQWGLKVLRNVFDPHYKELKAEDELVHSHELITDSSRDCSTAGPSSREMDCLKGNFWAIFGVSVYGQ